MLVRRLVAASLFLCVPAAPLVLSACASGGHGPAVPADSKTTGTAHRDHQVASCIRARIANRIDCLGIGKPCKPRYEHTYELYGVTCKQSPDGQYQLREYIYQGTPNPQPVASR